MTHPLKAEGADAGEDGTGRGVPMIPIQYADQWGRDKRQNGIGIGCEDDPMYTLDGSYTHGVGVRRLTPVECERLQGFPDGWTDIDPPRTPDSPRYRALGNAVTVPVIEWLGRRLA